MSKVLIERESIEAIARKIKLKTADTTKMRASDMPGRIGTLHGYRTNVQVLSTEPVSFPLSVFNLSDAGTAITTAEKIDIQTTQIMTKGQVSDTSYYMTAHFDDSIDLASYSFIIVNLYKELDLIGIIAVSPSSFPLAFTIIGDREYRMELTEKTIVSTYYSGSFVNLFVDVFGAQYSYAN